MIFFGGSVFLFGFHLLFLSRAETKRAPLRITFIEFGRALLVITCD